jgi:hypothetical protein
MLVMLFVYARIFKVANEREKMMGDSGGAIRFSMKSKANKQSGIVGCAENRISGGARKGLISATKCNC